MAARKPGFPVLIRHARVGSTPRAGCALLTALLSPLELVVVENYPLYVASFASASCRRLRFDYVGLEGLLGRELLVLMGAVAPKMSAAFATVANDTPHAGVVARLACREEQGSVASKFTVASPRPNAGNA